MRTLLGGFILIFIFATFELYFAAQTIPVATGDALYFYTPALYYKHLDTLINPVLNVGGELRFTWHGWLYPVLLSHIAPSADLSGIMVAEDILATITLLLFLACLQQTAPDRSVLKIVTLLSAITLVYANNGRPEMLVVLFLCAWYLIRMRSGPGYVDSPKALPTSKPDFAQATTDRPDIFIGGQYKKIFIDGVALGWIFITNPYAALVIGALGTCFYLSQSSTRKAFALSLSVACTTLLTAFTLTQLLYPYSFSEWLRGLLQNFFVVVHWRPIQESFYRYYIANPQYPLLIIWLTVLLFAIVLFSYQQRSKAHKVLIAFPILIFVFWFTFFRVPERNYYIVVFAPLCAIYILSQLHLISLKAQRCIITLLVAASLSVTLGLMRRNMKNLYSSLYGTPYEFASARALSLYERHRRQLHISGHFVTVLFGTEPTPLRLRNLIEDLPTITSEKSPHSIYLRGQTSSAEISPPAIVHYSLIEDQYYKGPREAFGVKIFNTPDAYNYAVWARDASEQ